LRECDDGPEDFHGWEVVFRDPGTGEEEQGGYLKYEVPEVVESAEKGVLVSI
jgi:hypothetical protein